MYDFFLDSFKKYISFAPEEEQVLVASVQLRKVRKKHWLIAPGEHCQTEFFVNKGCFRAYYVDESGYEHNTRFAPEGWWINDIHSMLAGTPATLYVEALEDGEVIAIHRPVMDQLFEQLPQLNKYFRLVYQKALVNSCDRLLRTISKTAGEHYLRFIEQYPNLEQRLPQYMVASYLGVTPEFLSKEKNRLLRKTGIKT